MKRGAGFALLFAAIVSTSAGAGCEREEDTPTPEPPRKKRKKKRQRAPAASVSAAPSVSSAPPAAPVGPHPGLLDPSQAALTAPATFQVRLDTTKGPITLACERSWSPAGADRFFSLVTIGFFRDIALYRMIPGFVVQWGIHGDPKVSAAWRDENLPAEPVVKSNTKGTMSFAMAAQPTTRSTQLFINLVDNARLDAMGFAPLCEVTEGLDVAEKFFDGHGSKPSMDQAAIQTGGNAHLRAQFPGLDYITSAAIISTP